MHTAKFAQFDVAGWNSLAGANDDGPAFGRFDCCPGHHPAAGQPVELLKGFHCSDPKFLGTTPDAETRSEEHTSELQSLMRISYAVFCLKKKKKHSIIFTINIH